MNRLELYKIYLSVIQSPLSRFAHFQDLPTHNGDDTFELPIPATYIIAPDRTVIYAFVNPDYTQRLEPTEILNVLERWKVAA